MPVINWALHVGNTGKICNFASKKESLLWDVAKIDGKDTELMSVFCRGVSFNGRLDGAEDPESGRPFPTSVVRFPQQTEAVTLELRTTVA